MEHLHGWFVAAAYAVFAVILLADAILPRIKFKSLLRGILLRERRSANTTRTASTADTP
jgi:heme exporter protein D